VAAIELLALQLMLLSVSHCCELQGIAKREVHYRAPAALEEYKGAGTATSAQQSNSLFSSCGFGMRKHSPEARGNTLPKDSGVDPGWAVVG
jgi:hypothetical protein